MSDSATPVFSGAAARSATLSVNALAASRVARLVDEAVALGVQVETDSRGLRLIDCGIDAPGSIEAGLLVGEICMGGLGRVALRSAGEAGAWWPSWVEVSSPQPVLACLGSQYAGWSLSASKEETGGKKFFSLGSGPARALAAKEALFAELGYRDTHSSGVLVMEVDKRPPPVILDKLLRDTGLKPEALTVVLTPTQSRAGTTQVVARVLEVALHRAHELKFPLADIWDGSATAPLPAPAADGIVAMGRTNDAILYGGRVHLTVGGSVEAAKALADALPSRNSRDYGRGFAEIFQAVDYDFYKIDGALFAPAEVWVSHPPSGQTFHAGGLNLDLLRAAWLAQG